MQPRRNGKKKKKSAAKSARRRTAFDHLNDLDQVKADAYLWFVNVIDGDLFLSLQC